MQLQPRVSVTFLCRDVLPWPLCRAHVSASSTKPAESPFVCWGLFEGTYPRAGSPAASRHMSPEMLARQAVCPPVSREVEAQWPTAAPGSSLWFIEP